MKTLTTIVSYQRFLLAGVLVITCLSSAPTYAVSTEVSTQVTPGLLTLDAPPSASLPNVPAKYSGTSVTSAPLGQVVVDDQRGTSAGWSLTTTVSNFASIGQPKQVAGAAKPLQAQGVYTESSSGTYTVTVTTGGTPGEARYSVTGLEDSSPRTIPADSSPTPIGTRGVSVIFTNTSYQLGDSWTISIRALPSNCVSITPSMIGALAGDLAGLQRGSGHSFTSPSDSATIMSAPPGSGFGKYANNPELTLVVPERTPSGTYSAVVTHTLN